MKLCVNPPLASIFFGKGQTWFSVSSQHTPGGLAKAVVAMAREALESLGISSVLGLLGPESMCSPSCCQPTQFHSREAREAPPVQHSPRISRPRGSSTFPVGIANAKHHRTGKDAGIPGRKKERTETMAKQCYVCGFVQDRNLRRGARVTRTAICGGCALIRGT